MYQKSLYVAVIFLSFALIAGCNDGGSETGGDDGGTNLTTTV